MSCEGKPGLGAYGRFLEGHEEPRSKVEESFRFAKGDLSGLEAQGRLIEKVGDSGERVIKLLPRQPLPMRII